jgi:hypothetical protein
MDSDAAKKTKIAALYGEMDRIRFLNSLYWESSEEATSETRAEYHRRIDRLEEIRPELVKLNSG